MELNFVQTHAADSWSLVRMNFTTELGLEASFTRIKERRLLISNVFKNFHLSFVFFERVVVCLESVVI